MFVYLILVVAFLEFVVEPRLQIRARFAAKAGAFLSYLIVLVVLITTDLLLSDLFPDLSTYEAFRYTLLSLLVFFIPIPRRTAKSANSDEMRGSS